MDSRTTGRWAAGALCGLAMLTMAGPVAGGVRYTAVTKGDHDGAALVEAEGAAIRVEFPERGMGFGKGDYLVSEDGGETIYWVQTKKRHYVRLDLDRLAAMAGRIAEGIPGVFWIHIEEPQVYRLFEEETEPLLGYPTRHVRYLMTYRSRMRVTLPAKHGAKSTREETWHQVVQDVWLTDAIDAPDASFWLRDRLRTGNADLDGLLAAQNRLTEGFPLRVETTRATSTRDLERTRVRLEGDTTSVSQSFYSGSGVPKQDLDFDKSTTEVVAFELTDGAIDPQRFRPPADFQEDRPKG